LIPHPSHNSNFLRIKRKTFLTHHTYVCQYFWKTLVPTSILNTNVCTLLFSDEKHVYILQCFWQKKLNLVYLLYSKSVMGFSSLGFSDVTLLPIMYDSIIDPITSGWIERCFSLSQLKSSGCQLFDLCWRGFTSRKLLESLVDPSDSKTIQSSSMLGKLLWCFIECENECVRKHGDDLVNYQKNQHRRVYWWKGSPFIGLASVAIKGRHQRYNVFGCCLEDWFFGRW